MENNIKNMLAYTPVVCVTGGDGYEKGKVYPLVGWNNGVHILRSDEYGNVVDGLFCTGGNGRGMFNNWGSSGAPSFDELPTNSLTNDETLDMKAIERLAIGVEVGYKDRNGIPIKVGDNVVYYKKCAKYVGEEEIYGYDRRIWVGTGHAGFIYTGKVIRQRHTVTFSFNEGFSILSGYKRKYLRETDENGNLITILVDNEGKYPKLTLEEVLP